MSQYEFERRLLALSALGDPTTEGFDYLEPHLSEAEARQLKLNPFVFFLGTDEATQDRIWNAMECRVHKRELLAAE